MGTVAGSMVLDLAGRPAKPFRLRAAFRRELTPMRHPDLPLFTFAALLRRIRGCDGGAMMLEFALALPALLALYSGAYVLSDMIACQHKVTIATRQLTDLVARSATLEPADVSGILAASAQVLAPYSGARAAITISEVQLGAAGSARVVWSQSLNGTALDAGSAVPLPPGTPHVCGVLILGQVRYAYMPAVSLGPAQSINLTDALAMTPRYGPQVELNGAGTAAPCS